MVKRCIVCEEEEAEYKIKDTFDYYCLTCAQENFSDLNLLVIVEKEAQKLKQFLKDKNDLFSPEEE